MTQEISQHKLKQLLTTAPALFQGLERELVMA